MDLPETLPPEKLPGLWWKDRSRSAAAIVAGALLMLWPAIYNGFPLLYPDSMTYLDDGRIVARAVFFHQLSGYYGMRSFFYSLVILPLHWNVTVWPVIVFQALLLAYVLWLVVCAVVTKRRTMSYLALMLALSAGTSLSWYVTLVLPDILGPAAYLCIFLLVYAGDSLSRPERVSLYLIAWWGITSHATHLLLAAGLCLLLGSLVFFEERPWQPALKRIGAVGLVVGAAAVAQLALHGYLYGEPSLSGQRPPFLLARVIADGPGRWYLEKHCGEVKWVVCEHLQNLSSDPDNLLWGADGLWQNLSEEDSKRLMQEEMPLVLATLRAYPKEQLGRSAANFWGQLQAFGYDDLDPSGWVLEEFDAVLPAAKQSYLKSRQAHDDLPLDIFGSVQRWTVIASSGVIAVFLARFWSRCSRRILGLSVVIVSMVLANALITGTLSMVEDRLQSRVVWLLPLLAGLQALVWLNRRQNNKLPAET